MQWQDLFSNQISQLLYNYPPDQITSSGQPFWSEVKRCPEPLTFDANNILHLDYVYASAILNAKIYGITETHDRQLVLKLVQQVIVPQFIPKSDVKIVVTDAEADENSSSQMVQKSKTDLKGANNLTITPMEFDKDDDVHMDYIVACSNLRATNYKIPNANRHTSKFVVGKIIPAIATASSVVSGLACLEIYKVAQG